MSELIVHVRRSVRERHLFRRGERIIVAVSGGVDSMALLAALRELAAENGWRLSVAHFNHQLRGRSGGADERCVRARANELQLPFFAGTGDVRACAHDNSLSIEMAARQMRHEFLTHAARQSRSSSIALAHHADDQIELFFLRLLRGSGSEGLGGMKWSAPSWCNRRIRLVRPFLDLPKAVLRRFASERGIRFREDATNAQLDFQRNRIRHQLLPLLRQDFQPALDTTLLRVMSILEAESGCIRGLADAWLKSDGKQKAGSIHQTGLLLVSKSGIRPSFGDLPAAIQRQCIRAQLLGLGVAADYDSVERLRTRRGEFMALANSRPPGSSKTGKVSSGPDRCASPGRANRGTRGGTAPWEVCQQEPPGKTRHLLLSCTDQGKILLKQPQSHYFRPGSLYVHLGNGPGSVRFGGATVSWGLGPGSRLPLKTAIPGQEVFDASTVGGWVVLRHWRAGDRFQPIGMEESVKLQDLFTNRKIPAERRRRLLVAEAANGQLFWVEGLRISEGYKVTKNTKVCLIWHWQSS